ncbi:MAG: ATPase [Novosphingobium sp.]
MWTGFFAWSQFGTLQGPPSPAQVAGWIRDWSVPVLLVAVIWLLVMRNSRSEAKRFADVSRQLSDESSRLETRLTTINSELSLAREFIASQSRDLESLGRQASDRLSQNADRLQSLISENSDQVETIGKVSTAALDNMEKLRSQLPVIANSARDVTSNIGNAGRTAHVQLQELIAGFKRLNEFGQASERQVETVRNQVSATIAEFGEKAETLGKFAEERHASLVEQGEEMRLQLRQFAEAAMSANRDRLKEMSAEIESAHISIRSTEEQSIEALRSRLAQLREQADAIAESLNEGGTRSFEEFTANLAAIDEAIGVRRQSHEDQTRSIAEHGETITAHLAELDKRIGDVTAHASEAESSLRENMTGFDDRLAEGRNVLADMGSRIWELTDASVRLLELIQAGSQHSRNELPNALIDAENRLKSVENRISALQASTAEAGMLSETLDANLAASQQRVADAAREIAALQERLGENSGAFSDKLEHLRAALEDVAERSHGIAERARSELAEAVEALSQSAEAVGRAMEESSAASLAGIAEKLGNESQKAVSRALEEHGAGAAAQLEAVSLKASETSREAAIQLRDQLAMVNELAANLETRVAHARQRAEEQVDNDFSRRVALITESLNSNAIDITRALDSEVADTAWGQYLKGDRGIFTRRAVSLIAASETKPILHLYESDKEFRDHVSRYIHDFEAMLRQVLSTRDGNALGVTLLSSDMGKLYVALAQAIERLRS